MNNAQLKKLVTEAVTLHRDIAKQNDRLKRLKADLVRESRTHKKEFSLTDGGGSRWTVAGTDGSIARVNFPAPALLPLIDSESETFDSILSRRRMHGSAFRIGLLPAPRRRFSRRRRPCLAWTRSWID